MAGVVAIFLLRSYARRLSDVARTSSIERGTAGT
jgi:hypothetical protein